MSSSPSRLSIPDALRGTAALGVCWHHFTNGNPAFLPEGVLKASGAFGWLMFFVISGFIIPYALQRSSYRVSDYGTFLLKRIVRLDPPYLVAIFVVIVLGYASAATPGFRGPSFAPSLTQVALHLGYINVFFGYPWLNPVFWTLAIELQYYLSVGLLFPVIAHRSIIVRASTFGFLAGLAFFVSADQFLFHYLFLFMLGMAAFQLHVSILRPAHFILWVALLGLGASYVNGVTIAITAVATALLLAFVRARVPQLLLFFGQISYSLFLLHIPIGAKVINLSLRFVHTTPGKLVVLATALAMSIGAAWLLYRYVERPAQKWSSAIRYRKKQDAGLGFAESVPAVAAST
jgi:peptidoglycan/LPS O-acetylase OafA/YrhL